jgi:hypothetical protein
MNKKAVRFIFIQVKIMVYKKPSLTGLGFKIYVSCKVIFIMAAYQLLRLYSEFA